MAIIKLICKQCGGQMELEDSREVAFCSFCGTKHVVKNDIINNTTINNTTQNIVKNFHGNVSADYKDVDELLVDAHALAELGHDNKAVEKYQKILDMDPKNAKAWFGYAKITRDQNAFRSAYMLNADKQFRNSVISIWSQYMVIEKNADFLEVYRSAEESHKNIFIKGAFPALNEDIDTKMMICETLYRDNAHTLHDFVLNTWILAATIARRGHGSIYTTVYELKGEKYAKEMVIPGWVKNVKMLMAGGVSLSRFSDLSFRITFDHLDEKDKEKIISNYVRMTCGPDKDAASKNRSALFELCTTNPKAMEILKKIGKSIVYGSYRTPAKELYNEMTATKK